MTFFAEALQNAIAWKRTTPLLTDAARRPAPMLASTSSKPYPHCLPFGRAAENLLPEAREASLSFFDAYGIPWQAGGAGRPSNNLLSSQVQCANVFAPVMHDADAVKRLLAGTLPIDVVLPWPSGEFLTFEWIGEVDYLRESRHGESRTRGSRATSADAAVRYRSKRGDIEIALVEWKYVEGTYDPELDGRNATRMTRHRRRFDDPDGPVRQDLVDYVDLFVNPFYQLLRLSLLAHAMERAGEHGATTVRVVLAAPCRNEAFHHQLARESLLALGPDVPAVWARLVRRPDRFISVDSGGIIGLAGEDSSLVARYRHQVPT